MTPSSQKACMFTMSGWSHTIRCPASALRSWHGRLVELRASTKCWDQHCGSSLHSRGLSHHFRRQFTHKENPDTRHRTWCGDLIGMTS